MDEKMYTNYYRCEHCDVAWQDEWSCACDDECPECHKALTPYRSRLAVTDPLAEFFVGATDPVEFVVTEGCTASNISANGRQLYGMDGMDEVELQQVADYVVSRLARAIQDGTASLRQVLELFQYGRYEDDDTPCDQCGDYVTRTYYTI